MFRVAPPGAYTVMIMGAEDHWSIQDIMLFDKSCVEDHAVVGISSLGRIPAGMANWSFWDLGTFEAREAAKDMAARWIEEHRGHHFWWVPNE